MLFWTNFCRKKTIFHSKKTLQCVKIVALLLVAFSEILSEISPFVQFSYKISPMKTVYLLQKTLQFVKIDALLYGTCAETLSEISPFGLYLVKKTMYLSLTLQFVKIVALWYMVFAEFLSKKLYFVKLLDKIQNKNKKQWSYNCSP